MATLGKETRSGFLFPKVDIHRRLNRRPNLSSKPLVTSRSKNPQMSNDGLWGPLLQRPLLLGLVFFWCRRRLEPVGQGLGRFCEWKCGRRETEVSTRRPTEA